MFGTGHQRSGIVLGLRGFVDVPKAVTPPVNDANEDVSSTSLLSNEDNQPSQDHCAPTKVTTNGSLDTKASTNDNSAVVKEVVVSEQPVTSSNNDGHTAAKSASTDQEDSQKISYSSMKNDGHTAAKSASNDLENSKKISYASMVAKERTVTSPTQSTPAVVVAPSSTHQQQRASAPLKASTPGGNGAAKNSRTNKQANGAAQNSRTDTQVKSIYVGNLPPDVSVEQLEAVFKKFGPIKKGGIKVRNFTDGFCYGFVEFELSKSACSAIELAMAEGGSCQKRASSRTTIGPGKALTVVATVDIKMGTVVTFQVKLEALQEVTEKLIRRSSRMGAESNSPFEWNEVDAGNMLRFLHDIENCFIVTLRGI
ncbi:hypothetical protein Acr_12g0009600 [Actinidia rufa]|uniref:RRM domain-containing protein n=1 Tax=Actinidia rufa TaxID=165716 RepID=A0A7J0FJS4_9ERIC|nr:hypothetical protein Acr_12g0009600 [Actinidia rufa]